MASLVDNCSDDVETYEDFGLKEDLLRGIYSCDHERPHGVQRRAIMPIVRGRDVVAIAPSDGDSSAALMIGVLQRIDETVKGCQAVIVTITRESALYLLEVVTQLGRALNVKAGAFVGGEPVKDSAKTARDCQIAIGTPGRLKDLINRRILVVDGVKFFACNDLHSPRGMSGDIDDIVSALRKDSQKVAFSESVTAAVTGFADRNMQDPVRIAPQPIAITMAGIRQFYKETENDDEKLAFLHKIYTEMNITQSIIYCRSNRHVDLVHEYLRQRDFPVEALRANMDQAQIDRTIKNFRTGAFRMLVTNTSVFRIQYFHNVALIINFETITEPEEYSRRAGRGRLTTRNHAVINFIASSERESLTRVQENLGIEVEPLPESLESI